MTRSTQSSLVTVGKAGEALGVSVSTIWRLIRRGDLPSILKGGRRLIPRQALEKREPARRRDTILPLTENHPIFRLVGAGRSGGSKPGARDKHAILDE